MSMLRAVVFAAGILAAGATHAASPEAIWKAGLADTDRDYAVVPHAILKIQDAAYLGEGESATLMGKRGYPGSYKWVPGIRPGGALVAKYAGGKPVLERNGQALDNPLADVPIDKDIDVQAYPTQVEAGVTGIRVFVYDQQNPAAKAFKGVDYFPYDPKFVVTATFFPDAKISAQRFITSRGTSKEFFRAGMAEFTLEGRQFSVPFYADTDDPKKISDLTAFFTDDLTGHGTYGAGRYVDVALLHGFPPRTFVIDFNYAYNPNCARSAFFTCPVAFDHLAIPITVGERDPHLQH
ncbi:MAG TPA: DUF1684 domain-containing protein [Rhizomicrobium sp.]|nr:DUF1684 domain-containing protein [Rhizomicrobium sp.]